MVYLDPFGYWDTSGNEIVVHCRNCAADNVIEMKGGRFISTRLSPPRELVEGLPGSIPTGPLRDCSEGAECLGIEAFRSACVMARRALQGGLLRLGIAEGSPLKMRAEAAKRAPPLLNYSDTQRAAGVTFFGGKGAHPQEKDINGARPIDARLGLLTAKDLLLTLFPPPAPRPPQRRRLLIGSVARPSPERLVRDGATRGLT